MTEEKERYELERQRPQVQLGMLNVAPEKVVAEGTRIATALAEIINSRRLYTQIGRKKYVHVDGWNTMGAMIGVLPKEEYVTKLEDGYEAGVLLIRVSDGMEVGRGTAICMRDERNWKSRDEYAIRSMAITRATGKAFRIGFSWILKLAGFEPTPAEEMPMVETQVIETEAKKVEPDNKDLFGSSVEESKAEIIEPEPKKTNGKAYPAYMVKALCEEEIATHTKNAVFILNLFPDLPRNTSKERVIELGKGYRARRAVGTELELQPPEAAEVAWKEWSE